MTQHKLSRFVLTATANLVTRHPRGVVAVFLALSCLSVYLTATKLQMKTDQNDLVSADLPYNQRFLEFVKDFGDLEFLYVVILVDGDPERAVRVADAVVEELSRLTDYVQDVLHRIHPKTFGDSVLLLGTEQELRDLAGSVADNELIVKKLGQVDGFPALLDLVAASLDPSMADRDREAAEWGFKFLDMSFASLLAAARGETPPTLTESIERIALGPGRHPRDRGYMFTGNLALVEVMPKKNYETLEVIREPLARIREALDRVRARFPDEWVEGPDGVKRLQKVQFGLTGRPVLQADEMSTTNVDMTRATILALVCVCLLFIAFFRRLRRPLLAILCLVVGIALTFGLTTVAIGYLTLLSVVFAAMLVGLGIDFGVHFLARYQEELTLTGDIEGSIRATLLSTGLGIWTGGITTSAAFYSTLLVKFRGLAELGFVAGSGLILCMITMLTLLPALVLLSDRHVQRRRGLHPPHLLFIPMLGVATRRAGATVVVLVAITAAGFLTFRGVPYNWNLLDLQAKGLESVEYELKFIEQSDRSTWDAAFIVDSLEAVDRTIAALKPYQDRKIVGAVESIRDFVGTDEKTKMEILRPAGQLVSRVRLPETLATLSAEGMDAAVEKLLDGLDLLQSGAAKLAGSSGSGDKSSAVESKEALEGVKALQTLIDKLVHIQELLEDEPEQTVARLQAYQTRWFAELREVIGKLSRLLNPPPVTVQSLPISIRRRYVSLDETKYLVHAYPMKDIWEEENMKEFMEVIRKVDPDVTGVPVQVFESARLMRDGFLLAALYSLIMVFILIVIDFRSLGVASLTLIPLGAGLLWTLQFMPLLGLDFNLANFFALPILVGYGVAGGVHVIHRFREFRSCRDLKGTVSSAVSLSFLTTIVGFGCMAIARHRGVASLGTVTAIGCTLVLLASIVLLPAILALLPFPGGTEEKKADAGPPGDRLP